MFKCERCKSDFGWRVNLPCNVSANLCTECEREVDGYIYDTDLVWELKAVNGDYMLARSLHQQLRPLILAWVAPLRDKFMPSTKQREAANLRHVLESIRNVCIDKRQTTSSTIINIRNICDKELKKLEATECSQQDA